MSEFADWIGRSQSTIDVFDCARSNALCAALGQDCNRELGDELPLLHHWLYFWDVKTPKGLGVDGHPAKGGFLPPVPLPRRMWAGGRLSFHRPLRLGDTITKTSVITAINEKSGRSGKLVFVTVCHTLHSMDGLVITEEQDLVYRDPVKENLPMPTAEPAPAAQWVETVDPDPVLLFRYSALTMNGHRIHFDLPYAEREESYPGLVVHGPLQATLLIDIARRNLSIPITGFDFRGQQPAFSGVPLHVCGSVGENGVCVWTQQGKDKNMIATVRTEAI